ncbi:uncharacterized protein LOC117100742 [Anneissia japonica]|uniref:uncharacterized protein LOC117100742 n=1 Tax=Anneissia japonica TaxID=1529436 RepID=UPI0014256788|nr:uncharacterized protein LOC117100742 [Anneissia japonica]
MKDTHRILIKTCGKSIGEDEPTTFTVNPVNHPASLIHWRCLAAIAERVESGVLRAVFERAGGEDIAHSPPSNEKRKHLEEKEGKPKRKVLPQARGTPHSSQGSMPKIYDAHFHMDRLRQGLGVSFMANLSDLERVEPPRGDVRPVSVAGGIAVYCDPQTYPTTREINFITRDLHLNVAVGVHPKQSLTSDQFDRLHSLSRMSEVKVLGEIGLDHSRPPSDWYRQEGLFRRVLNRSPTSCGMPTSEGYGWGPHGGRMLLASTGHLKAVPYSARAEITSP